MIKLLDLPSLERQVVEHVVYALASAPIHTYPFPHFYATNVFPADYYPQLVEALPEDGGYSSNPDGKYANRVFAEPDIPGLNGFRTREFVMSTFALFEQWSRQLANGGLKITTDLRLIRDTNGYAIGPHTDARWKMISLLFYLPPPGTPAADYGTSLYVPREPGRTCPGGPHHSFEDFVRVWTAPFAPNSCVGFWKTDNAFHGVEPLPDGAPIKRDVLLFNVYNGGLAPK